MNLIKLQSRYELLLLKQTRDSLNAVYALIKKHKLFLNHGLALTDSTSLQMVLSDKTKNKYINSNKI